MPIRFHCPKCNQRLSVGSRKAGTEATCPKCAAKLRVPTPEVAPESSENVTAQLDDTGVAIAPPSGEAPEQGDALFQEFVVYDDGPLVADDVEVVAPVESSEDLDSSKLAIPRWVVFTQGLLLGIVGLACFVFGLMIGARSSVSETAASEPVPCVITGNVRFDQDARTPDVGAVVIVVPQESRPEQKIDAARLSPLEPAPLRDDPRLAAIRALGGAYTRVDESGGYRLRVPDKGNYFLLFISRGKRQRASAAFDAIAAAQMGRFFSPTLDMLGEQAYVWQTRLIRSDTTINQDFE